MLINQMTVTLYRQTKNLVKHTHQMVVNQIQMDLLTHVVLLLKVCSLILIMLPKVLAKKLQMRIKFSSMKQILHGKVTKNINSKDYNRRTGENINGQMQKMVSTFKSLAHFYRTLYCLDENSRATKLQKTLWQNRN